MKAMTIENWESAREVLQSKLAALNEQISSYPGPITGCDAQFNHMLTERSELNAALSRLDTAISAGADMPEFKKFMESCPHLAG